jgi:Rod binding domain-containing protein
MAIPVNPIRPQVNPEQIPAAYREVAQGLEAQFVELMLQEMEKTVHHSATDQASEFYRSTLNNERAKLMAEHGGGMGIAQMILQQIYPAAQQPPPRPNPPANAATAIKIYGQGGPDE